MKSILLSLLFSVATLLMPLHVLAANYGECGYGDGDYNEGCSPSSPTSTPSPVQNNNSGSSGSTGSSGSPASGECTADKPTSAPDLFQINAKPDSLILYFSPVITNRDRYFISYSTRESAEEHGYEFVDSSNGVVSVDIGYLQKSTVYYFKVRAGNSCQPGEWSNVLAARTGQRFPSYKWSSLPRIVSTGLAGRLKPSSVQRMEVDARTLEPITVQESLPPKNSAPAQTPTIEQPSSPPEQPSLLNRVTGFFKQFLGR